MNAAAFAREAERPRAAADPAATGESLLCGLPEPGPTLPLSGGYLGASCCA